MSIEFYYAIILGIVQGITEFLPISSSGHLFLLHEAFAFATDNSLSFDIALHIGTLLSIVVFFAKDIIHYARTRPKLLLMALVSCLPAGLVGLLLGDWLDETFRSNWVVVAMLVAVGIIFLLVEKYTHPVTPLEQVTWKQALTMGLVQVLALIPGTSRSGITMSFGMAMGLKREAAARFSFIMVIPLLLGLTLKQGADLMEAQLSQHDLIVMALGAITAAIVGMLAIRWLLRYFTHSTLRPFAYYRFALAVVVSLILFL